jgi:succinate dehydrogenase/fumarate reductase-like Fe-S protein
MTKLLIYTIILACFIVLFIVSIPTRLIGIENFRTICNYRRRPYYRYNFRYPYKYNKYCSECDNKSLYSCKNCINCGLCYNANGNIECVPGDARGPYFREECAYWQYN